MKVLVITGGIGSGKSTVASLFAEKGAFRIDADRIVRELLLPGSQVYWKVKDHFGERALNKSGEIDRGLLADIVFNDPAELDFLEKTTHPEVTRIIRETLREAQDAGAKIVVIEVQIPGKTDILEDADKLIVVEAEEGLRLRRLSNRGLSEEDARRRMAAGPVISQLAHKADIIIDNNGSVEDLRRKVDAIAAGIN